MQSPMDLIATKTFTYQTRRLKPGDTFQASRMDGRILLAVKRASKAEERDPADLPPVPPALTEAARQAGATTELTTNGDEATDAGSETQGSGIQDEAPGGAPGGTAGPASAPPPERSPTIEELRAEAAALGLKADNRLGIPGLTRAIADARAAAGRPSAG